MKKLLIIGRGQIGSAFAHDLTEFEVHIWSHDIDDLTSDVLQTIAPDAIINAAGKTDLAWCEENAREALRSNLEAPVRLYQRMLEAQDAGTGTRHPIRFIHFSSGCIWDGPYTKEGNPFTPDISPSPVCLYSWTKAASDAMLLDLDPTRIAILRPRQVYSASAHPRNMLAKLLKYPKLIDTPNSVSSIGVITQTLRHVLGTEHAWNGIWNVYDRGTITPFQIGEMLWHAGLRAKPERISKAELDAFHKPKRVDTVLYDARFETAIRPEPVLSVIARTIEEWKTSTTL